MSIVHDFVCLNDGVALFFLHFLISQKNDQHVNAILKPTNDVCKVLVILKVNVCQCCLEPFWFNGNQFLQSFEIKKQEA